MKNILRIMTLLILISGTVASAQGVGTVRMEAKGNASSTVREKVLDKLQTRRDNRFDKMNKRYEATIDRLNSIMARINSRIEKIKNAGGKTETAEKFVAEAKIEMAEAKVSLNTIKVATETFSMLDGTASSTEIKNSIGNIRKITKELTKNLVSARIALAKALGSLRGLSQLQNATSTQN